MSSLISRRGRIGGRIRKGGERRVCGARWIPDRHLAVKLLESPENEDGYTSVHFAFPIPAGARSLVLSSCPPFLVLLLHLLFLLRLLLLFIPSSASRRRSHPVRKEEARSKMRYSKRRCCCCCRCCYRLAGLAG